MTTPDFSPRALRITIGAALLFGIAAVIAALALWEAIQC